MPGTLDDIIDVSRAGDDHSAVLERIRAEWMSFVGEDGDRLRDLLDRIPAGDWQHDPWLVTAYASSYRSVGSHSRTAALPYFEAARAMVTDETPAPVRAGLALHRAALLRSLGDFEAAVHEATAAADLARAQTGMPLDWRILFPAKSALELGIARYHLGDYDAAFAQLRLAAGLSARLARSDRVECLGALAVVEYTRGNFDRAVEAIGLARAASEGTDLLDSPFGAPALVADLLIAVEQDRLADAETLATTLASASERCDWEPLGYYARAAISIISQQYVEGLDLLRRCLQSYRRWDSPGSIVTMSEGLRATLLLRLGEIDTAWDILGSLEPTQHHANCPGRFIAHLRFVTGDIPGVLAALRECEALGDTHSSRTLVDVMLLKAAAHYQLGATVIADVAFDRALILAANNGMRIPFRLVPDVVMRRMLSGAAARTQPAEVQALFAQVQGAAHVGTMDDPPLSRRERDILRALLRGLSVSQISDELFISVNTVKSHLKSAYRKLGVGSRAGAVKRARELGLQLEITPD